MGRNPLVLLVDADVEHRALVRQLLASLPFAVAGEAMFGVEAAQLAAELQPDLVLVHVEEPLAIAFRTLGVVQDAAPHATLVVISRRDDGATARKAMLWGARGFIVSPPSAAALAEALTMARENHRRRRVHASEEPAAAVAGGTVVTILGPKGGVGKTTLATNLAIAIRRRTQAGVALVDVDANFGDVAVVMGMSPERTVGDLMEAYDSGHVPALDPYLSVHESGVRVLAARHTTEVSIQPPPEGVAALLRDLARRFDFVVADTPGAFVPQVASALDEATTVLLVTSADISSIKDARLAVSTLCASGFDTDRLKLVINHATSANSVTDQEIARAVGYDVFWSLPHDRAVPESTQHGAPIVLSRPKAAMAQQVDALAAYFGGDVVDGVPPQRRPWRLW